MHLVTGPRIQGTLRWVNHPHRRSDGSMLPDAHGAIGQGQGKQLLSALFEAQAEPYRWLNAAFFVLEGLIDGERRQMRARVYACRSDLI